MCVLDEQVAACEDLAADALCSFPGVSDGRCLDGVCFGTGCGNFVLEDGEECDDGNTVDGDGCSADCNSDETCGNGQVDAPVGERCDDGNTVDGDDCQADCSLPQCGDGIKDPGEVCDDGNDTNGDGCNRQCTSDETCGTGVIDVAAGEECDDDNLLPGDGCGPTCLIEACGNGVMDPGEVCDDDNNEAGDGCSPTCLSLEVCGNGIIDPTTGETCDDGNARSHDGCSSACTVEAAVWTPVPSPIFVERNEAAAAYDTHRERAVMFGGFVAGLGVGDPVDDTWEYDGKIWRRANPATSPPARGGHVMAYDAKRRVVVLYGGEAATANLGDTWEYDGTTWVNTTNVGPPVCAGAAMAYDAIREEMVLWGCNGVATYVYDGVTWIQRASVGPPPRAYSSLVFHAGRGTVFMTGGSVFDGGTFSFVGVTDTWEWDGAAWTEIVGATTPTATGPAVYDAGANRIVVFGGYETLDITSVWDGSWTDLASATVPPGRMDPAMAYDAARNKVVMAGGDVAGPGTSTGSRNDTWELVGNNWQAANIERAPTNRSDAAGAFDLRRGRAVVFGGDVGDVALPPNLYDTWELVGDTWHPVDTVGAPTDRSSESPESMVFSTDAGVCLMFTSRPGPGSDTWTFDGRNWSGVARSGGFSAEFAVIAYDSARGVVVMVNHGDTWEYDGMSWWENDTAPELGSTQGHIAYDPVRDVVVYVSQQDTWEYDTSVFPPTWTNVGVTTPAHGFGAMVWHEARGTIVFFTALSVGGAAVQESWEYDGTSWSKLVFPIFPPVGESPTLIDDPIGARLLLIGGRGTHFDMWQMQWRSGSPEEDCSTVGDEDGDGVADCDDPDCLRDECGANGLRCTSSGTCTCPGGSTETRCGDSFDDDCDGLVDCADPDCAAVGVCGAEADCTDGTDDDSDGVTDCADPGCAGAGFCEATETLCGDGEDNDGDGLTDCEDTNCYLAPCLTILP